MKTFKEYIKESELKINTKNWKIVKDNLISIPPQDFLNLAVPFGYMDGPKKDLKKIKALSKIKNWETIPYLTVKRNEKGNFQVGLHDGRNRAEAAILRGDKTFEILLKKSQKLIKTEPNLTESELTKEVLEKDIIPEV